MPLPAFRCARRAQRLCGQVTRLKDDRQFKPFIYLNTPRRHLNTVPTLGTSIASGKIKIPPFGGIFRLETTMQPTNGRPSDPDRGSGPDGSDPVAAAVLVSVHRPVAGPASGLGSGSAGP